MNQLNKVHIALTKINKIYYKLDENCNLIDEDGDCNAAACKIRIYDNNKWIMKIKLVLKIGFHSSLPFQTS